MNLVTPKGGAKHELLFNKPASRLVCWTLKSDLSRTAKCDKIRCKLTIKGAAKGELLFNKLTSEQKFNLSCNFRYTCMDDYYEMDLLNIYVGLRQHNKVWPKFIAMIVINVFTLKSAAKEEILFNNVTACEASLLNKCSCLARALRVIKFTTMRNMILVTLCCAI